MTHIFKIRLDRADMIIYRYDQNIIEYSILDWQTNEILVPRHEAKIVDESDRVMFDGFFLTNQYAEKIFLTLASA